MDELFSALADPHLGFLRHAFLMGILGSIAFGVTGAFVAV